MGNARRRTAEPDAAADAATMIGDEAGRLAVMITHGTFKGIVGTAFRPSSTRRVLVDIGGRTVEKTLDEVHWLEKGRPAPRLRFGRLARPHTARAPDADREPEPMGPIVDTDAVGIVDVETCRTAWIDRRTLATSGMPPGYVDASTISVVEWFSIVRRVVRTFVRAV